MTDEERRLAKMLLEIHGKAYQGLPWTQDDEALIEGCFQKEGEIRFLAACCVLAASSLLKNSKFFSERFCEERLVFNSVTRVRE